MTLIETLIKDYLSQEKWYIIIIAFLSLAINFFQVNGISIITAKIIESIHKNRIGVVKQNYVYFIIVSILFLLFYHAYKHYQNLLFTKLPSWLRRELVKIIIETNNENISPINFSKLITPINRIANSTYGLFYRILVHMFPDVVFIFVISFYFLYKSIPFGVFFLIANIFLMVYMFTGWSDVLTSRKEYEEESNNNEKYLIDMFNNMEKIIFRGKGQDEIDTYSNQSIKSTKKILIFMRKLIIEF